MLDSILDEGNQSETPPGGNSAACAARTIWQWLSSRATRALAPGQHRDRPTGAPMPAAVLCDLLCDLAVPILRCPSGDADRAIKTGLKNRVEKL